MMNAQTGREMDVLAHIGQSVRDILFTRIGTRVQREEYGSLLPDLIDAPLNEATLLRCAVASVAAVARWEPRVDLNGAQVLARVDAQTGVYIRLRVSVNGRAAEFVLSRNKVEING